VSAWFAALFGTMLARHRRAQLARAARIVRCGLAAME
jgi:hypothetical protein